MKRPMKRGERGEGRDREKKEFDQTVVEISRVTRVVAGGKRMRFRALVVIGDRKGGVGVGVKKGLDVSEAVSKAATAARKDLVRVSLMHGTIPHEVHFKYKASKVMLKPARPGTGVIAGGSIRPVVVAAGISDIVCKMMGSSNKVNNIRAVLGALSQLKQPRVREQAPATNVQS